MTSTNLQQWWEHTYRQHKLSNQQADYEANILTQHQSQQQQQQLLLLELQQQQQQQQHQQQHNHQHQQYEYEQHKLHFLMDYTSALNFTKAFTSTTSSASTSTALPTTAAFVEAATTIERLSGNHYDASAFGNYYFINNNIFNNSSSLLVPTDAEYTIPSLTILFMTISYGLVVFGGVLGNATLVLTLCSASSVRLRNPLLLAVCIADLLVTGISAPITLLNLAMNRSTKSLPLAFCKLIHFIQIMPVAASTISFFLLSLDRYATVKHPRLAQLRQRRYLHLILAIISWLISAAISAPFLFAYKIIAKSVFNNNANMSANTAVSESVPTINVSCSSVLGHNRLFTYFIYFHTFVVFVLPGFGVLLNHYGVRQKLCALSLTARAAHGELPLPMPILRRQTHMVIVTGLAKVQTPGTACATQTDDTSNEAGNIQLHNLNPMLHTNIVEEQREEDEAEQEDQLRDIECPPVNIPLNNRRSIKPSNPISPRAMREIRAHSQRQRINNNSIRRAIPGSCVPATPGIPLPQISTLHSRRRLANMLIASAFIFILCWTPHVFCIIYTNFGYTQYCDSTATYFNLLLGYMYSAISPVIYWILNHNTLRQSPCAPIIRMRSMQNFLRARFRTHTVPPPPPSSTNEAALGAFNPKFIKLTPKQYRAQASSHYLY